MSDSKEDDQNDIKQSILDKVQKDEIKNKMKVLFYEIHFNRLN